MTLTAQQLIGAVGNYYQSSAGSISWSVGEVAVRTISGTNNQLTQGFQQAAIMNVTVDAGESVNLCQTKALILEDLSASLDPSSFSATWSTSGSGTFDDTNSQTGVFGVATLYQPSAQDIADGHVILTLTADINCSADTVEILILRVACGSFPWNGN
ncbi:MAG: hypothetical protein H6563_03670 [Lewinellaceae bacterium]|nr:hypothetical protein [Lewinellaceae bacterium]